MMMKSSQGSWTFSWTWKPIAKKSRLVNIYPIKATLRKSRDCKILREVIIEDGTV